MALELFYKDDCVEAGCDEAGRGCLSGPVFAAAVVLPTDFEHPLLNDSKQISEKNRYILREFIESNASAWAVASCSPEEIDEMNILRASITSMHRAIEKLSPQPQHLIIDGNKFYPYKDIPHKCIVKGDAKYASIAAASILAKTYRDDAMKKLHEEFPGYDWDQNKGYPTKKHKAAIWELGTTPHHRKSFRLFDEQMKIQF